ncbi:hypothetical protein [Actinokineospora globicatena]|uniref:Uncharacterized protein n=1 Tax=Actinokineospora globicatena TaxID=103729 RepID=A0A9W6VAG2_9PSEU|nr:hypothetical protein [Actinokineospora globicatena]MCP2304819.1 hypothetical protein [Actinokineospora globicatena]GLW77803.1 hypothetical protein Aglo01_22850 [Actinokineospora globicatena]GLW85529.1 hypothetical protein Aglo02_31690 [Actinokineospora globicatena]GLW94277.1 hypothetical protein Aglo03_50930 [Actinokineospora globicatena]
MANSAQENTSTRVPDAALRSAAAFVAAHGTPSRGVVEGIGRAGVRVVLIGKDGAVGDVLVPSAEAGAALVDRVEGLEGASWDRETVAATRIGPGHRAKMASRFRG